MRIVVLYNPVSGAGRAERTALPLVARLQSSGHHAEPLATQVAPPAQWLEGRLEPADLLVVVGGDGAIRMSCGTAGRTATPVYHYAAGTENLFAREFGMRPSAAALLGAIERSRLRAVDLAEANGRTFALMASVGYDAEVVHDLAARRGASISRLTYLGPMLRQLRRWQPPRLDVRVDGEPAVEGERGFVVIANSRHYAYRLNPARRASMTDGLLDVAFFPTSTPAALLAWAARCRIGRQERRAALRYLHGREVEVRCDAPQRFQLDGDPPDAGGADAVTDRLAVTVRPGALQVLLAADVQ